MNFFELINKCLLELNYKEVASMAELVKNDHKRIKNILNIINKEICNSDEWDFLLKYKNISIPANSSEIITPVDGRILYFIIDGKNYEYCKDKKIFVSKENIPQGYYFSIDNKIFLPKFSQAKNAEIFYYTSKSAQNSDGDLVDDMTNAQDKSLIPMPFAEQILVYGACLRLKANPSYVRFNYWMSMYKEALRNLKSKCSIYAKETSKIRLYRE